MLELTGVLFTDHEFLVFISRFPLLEDLTVRYCLSLEWITISSNLLKNLSIDSCYNLMAIDIDAPNLLSFRYYDNPIPVFSMNVPCPWKVEFRTGEVDPDTRWYLKIKEFLAGSNQVEDVILYVCSEKKWLHQNLMNVDASCCDSHDIKCWRHYLKDIKGFFVPEIRDQKPIRVDNFKDAPHQYGTGTFMFHLNWCFPKFLKKA
ncbi:hypothetical protein Ddye_027139 [Dipteronia dyeriana]|uniref:At1g61320/AtMIF1 LRR domain-containing protein n=1 Tax=Dipteronia dyeriana TaxID=168575 RepID=A0AAD9WPW9_9ROSI|nr:hypothetical protein Ddye_027139 [Dipteronia dyeriana]